MQENITEAKSWVETRIHILFVDFSPRRGVFHMLEGRCPKCGIRYYGWALFDTKYQTCPDCGTELELKESNGTISEGYSPPLIDKSRLKEIMNIVNGKKKGKQRHIGDEE
jgi:hypothetical protein